MAMQPRALSDLRSSDEKLIGNKPPRARVPMRNNVGVAARPWFGESNNGIHIPIRDGAEMKWSSQIQPTASKLDKAIFEFELKHGRALDPKQLRRTVSNRLSAQKSRLRKAQYIHNMEHKVTELEGTVAFLGKKSAWFEEKRRLLKLQNQALGQLLAIRQIQANQAQLDFERIKEELNRLKELHKVQLKIMSGAGDGNSSGFLEDEQVGMDEQDPFLNFDD